MTNLKTLDFWKEVVPALARGTTVYLLQASRAEEAEVFRLFALAAGPSFARGSWEARIGDAQLPVGEFILTNKAKLYIAPEDAFPEARVTYCGLLGRVELESLRLKDSETMRERFDAAFSSASNLASEGLPPGMREELAAKPVESPRKADLPASDSEVKLRQDAALGRYLALQLERDERWPDINAIPPNEEAEEEAICDAMDGPWYQMGEENLRCATAFAVATRHHFKKRAHPKRDPLGDGVSELQLIDFMGDDLSIVRAARVSTARDGVEEGAEKLLNYLAKNRHDSPQEHNAVTIRVKAPLFVVQQWLRHRIGWSFNQESRRYTSENIEFYIPKVWRTQGKTNKQASGEDFSENQSDFFERYVRGVCADAQRHYEFLLTQGVAREMARGILPANLYSSLYLTFNVRSAFHFWELRSAPEAQWEIRQYALALGELMAKLFPMAWKALTDASQEKKRLREENAALKAQIKTLESFLPHPTADGIAPSFIGAPKAEDVK